MVERSSFLSRFTLGLLASLAVTTVAMPEADAQKKPSTKERDAARDAYNQGTTAYESGNYTGALESFNKANGIIPSPHAQYWIAMAYDRLDRKQEAIEAFETLLASPDVGKIGEEKQTNARDRLAQLKKSLEPEPTPPPSEEKKPPEPPPEETPAKPLFEEPLPEAPSEQPPEASSKVEWKGMAGEIGLFGGVLSIAKDHGLKEDQYDHIDYKAMYLVGLRGGFYPVKYFGIEVEYAHGWGKVKQPLDAEGVGGDNDRAQVNTLSGSIVPQFPVGRFVPFAVLGAGMLHATSDRLGSDGDFMLQFGAGAKILATKMIAPRLDLRLDLSQDKDGSFGALHPEILLGLDLVLGN